MLDFGLYKCNVIELKWNQINNFLSWPGDWEMYHKFCSCCFSLSVKIAKWNLWQAMKTVYRKADSISLLFYIHYGLAQCWNIDIYFYSIFASSINIIRNGSSSKLQ